MADGEVPIEETGDAWDSFFGSGGKSLAIQDGKLLLEVTELLVNRMALVIQYARQAGRRIRPCG